MRSAIASSTAATAKSRRSARGRRLSLRSTQALETCPGPGPGLVRIVRSVRPRPISYPFAEPGFDRIRAYIGKGLFVVLLTLDHARREATLKHMTAVSVTIVEALRVASVQPLHPA